MSETADIETRSNEAHSFTEPFGLVARLQKADTRLDFIPILDLVVISLLVSLLFTRFVVFPGVQVDLPVTEMRTEHTQLPVAVLTVGNNGMLLFDGSVYEVSSIFRGFQDFAESSGSKGVVLLVKVEASMDMQYFLTLCDMAKRAGFTQVQLTGQKDTKDLDLIDTGKGLDATPTLF